jgi:hypothetical protein
MTSRSSVLRAAFFSGLCLCALPALAVAQKGGRTNKTVDTDKPVESMSNTVGRRVRSDLDDRDPLNFLLKHDKQLTLTAVQKDSIKFLQKAMDNDQKPIFKELQKSLADADRDASLAAGGGRGGMPPVARDLVTRLNEVQDTYGTKAHAQLNESQQHVADSLQTIHAAELKEKAEKGRGGRPGQ